jgi:hypothetical protein
MGNIYRLAMHDLILHATLVLLWSQGISKKKKTVKMKAIAPPIVFTLQEYLTFTPLRAFN